MGLRGIPCPLDSLLIRFWVLIAEQAESISRWDRFFKLKKKSPLARVMGKGRLCVMGLCGVGESHAPDAFAAVLNPTTDTHLSATRIHNDGIMQGAALPSTPPVWVATGWFCRPGSAAVVSIHATRVGGDAQYAKEDETLKWFLSTPPVWVATLALLASVSANIVSIHATRVGGDSYRLSITIVSSCFYPRHPCGWRQKGFYL